MDGVMFEVDDAFAIEGYTKDELDSIKRMVEWPAQVYN